MSTQTSLKQREKVYLNVYDLADNGLTHKLGLGAYHSGVECFSNEITFGQGGIIMHEPKKAGELSSATPETQGGCRFRESILLGETEMTLSELRANVIPHLERKMGFIDGSYDLMRKNCNSFSDELAKILLNSKKSVVPGWINRAAKIGSTFSGFMPTANKPEEHPNEPFQQKPSFDAFSGEGRTLGSRVSNGASQEQVQRHQKQEQKGSWFSRWFGKGDTSETKNAKPAPTTSSAASTVDSHEEAPQETEEERRKRVLQATMNRLGKA